MLKRDYEDILSRSYEELEASREYKPGFRITFRNKNDGKEYKGTVVQSLGPGKFTFKADQDDKIYNNSGMGSNWQITQVINNNDPDADSGFGKWGKLTPRQQADMDATRAQADRNKLGGVTDMINHIKSQGGLKEDLKNYIKEVVNKKLNARQTFAKDLQQDPDYHKAKEDAKKITPTLYFYDDSIIDKKEDYGVPNVLNTDYFIDKDKLKKINQSMKTFITKEDLKNYIKEALKKRLAENQPAPSRETEPGETETIPDRGTEEEKKRRRIGNPDVKPRPKAMNENEQEIIKKIVARFKSKK